jgi:hypothetical protein
MAIVCSALSRERRPAREPNWITAMSRLSSWSGITSEEERIAAP